MKKLNSLIAAVCVGVLSVAAYSTAYAGSRAGTATFTVGGGYYYFASKRNIDNTGFPFVGAGYNFTDNWGIDAILGNFTTDSNRSYENGQEVNGTIFLVDGVYHFSQPNRGFEPYLLAGVGILGMNPNGNEANNEANINAGLGALVFANEVVAFRMEARDLYTIRGGKNDVFLDGGVTFLWDI